MPVKDILVCVDPTEAGIARLHLAVQLARAHGAHLSAAYVTADAGAVSGPHDTIGLSSPSVGSDPDHNIVWGLSFAEADTTAAPRLPIAEMLEARYREIGQEYATGDWHLLADDASVELVELIRTHDLAIVGQSEPDHRMPSGFRPNDLVMVCGRPLLVMPYVGTFDTVGRRVLIAWDGTREATRGLHDALPLLAYAELAVVMTVRTDEASFSSEASGLGRIVRHLERHGILARPEEAMQGDIPIADVLLARAADLDIDLIVAGAFHHSQIREAMFGGVSRGLLDHMTVPLLLSH